MHSNVQSVITRVCSKTQWLSLANQAMIIPNQIRTQGLNTLRIIYHIVSKDSSQMDHGINNSRKYRDKSEDDFTFIKYFVGIIIFMTNLAATCITNLISLPEASKSRNKNQIYLKSNEISFTDSLRLNESHNLSSEHINENMQSPQRVVTNEHGHDTSNTRKIRPTNTSHIWCSAAIIMVICAFAGLMVMANEPETPQDALFAANYAKQNTNDSNYINLLVPDDKSSSNSPANRFIFDSGSPEKFIMLSLISLIQSRRTLHLFL